MQYWQCSIDRSVQVPCYFGGAVEIAAFAVLDNHLHVLVRLYPELAGTWTDEEVVRRWADVFPPRGPNRAALEISQAWLDEKLGDAEFVAQTRLRLADLGWFMKCLKEPLARRRCGQVAPHLRGGVRQANCGQANEG